MSRRCLICEDINPCRAHSPSEQEAELARNDCAIAALATPAPRGDDALREADARDANERISAAMMGMVPGAISTEETELPGGLVSHRTFVKCSYDDLRIVLAALDAFATPVPHKADEGVEIPAGLREAIARALWSDFVDQHGYPNGLPTWDELPEEMPGRVQPATKGFMLSLADAAIATLSPAPCLSDERDKLEAAQEAAFQMIYGPGADAFHTPDAFDFAGQVAEAVIAALDTPSTGEEGK